MEKEIKFEKKALAGLVMSINQIGSAIKDEINMTGIIGILDKNVLSLDIKELCGQEFRIWEAVKDFIDEEKYTMKRAASPSPQAIVNKLYTLLNSNLG